MIEDELPIHIELEDLKSILRTVTREVIYFNDKYWRRYYKIGIVVGADNLYDNNEHNKISRVAVYE